MTQTIGQRLKAEREEQRLTLEKVFEATRIRIQYLQALEADDFTAMPSPMQARGFLRNYAEYLGLNFEQLLDELRAASTRQTSGEIIGPAESAATFQYIPPSQDGTELPESALQKDGPSAFLQDKSLLVEEQASVPLSAPLSPSGKLEPVRRKRADSQPASAEPTTRRRGRIKTEPESEPVSLTEESVAPIDSIQQPEIPEEPVFVESIPEPEPVTERADEQHSEAPQQADVSDNLWQKWLNRFGSVLSARMKRPTLAKREAGISETDSGISLATPDQVPDLEPKTLPLESSAEIFKEIGRELRSQREQLSLHLDEVERNIHVKAHYLAALEKGAMDELPSTVQTRGMLSNYATFLDLDADALLLRFADALQTRHRERNPQKPVRKQGQPFLANIPPIRSFIAGDMIFGVGTVILLVAFAIWGVSRVLTIQGQREVQPTAPSISDVLLTLPAPSLDTATPTVLAVESFPGEATVTVVIPTQNLNVNVQVNLIAVERTFMRVIADGEVVFEGRVVPGNAYPYEAETQVEVLVGSGAAIRIVYNGRDLGLLGTFGQVVNNIYRPDEIITPTALPTATPTSTVSPTSTVPPTSTIPPTQTSRPTSTPAPSNTP